jgi:hypothetical protein
MQKDRSRFAETGGWGFEGFIAGDPTRTVHDTCLLLGVKRTTLIRSRMSANDQKRTCKGWRLIVRSQSKAALLGA